MKNKISFTSVLKNKSNQNNLRQFNTSSSNYSNDSQNRQQKLIDIYQQYQIYPEENYTLDLNSFKNYSNKFRNSSINMIKSRNTNEDPQMNLDTWIENQKFKENTESFTKNKSSQRAFKFSINNQSQQFQQQGIPMVKSRSTMKRQQQYYQPAEHQQYQDYQSQYQMQNSKQNNKIQQTQKNSFTANRKSPIAFNNNSQKILDYQTNQNYQSQKMIQSSKPSLQDMLTYEQFKPRNQFPDLQDSEYDQLNKNFEKIKSQKIAQLCMKTKKTINKEKLQQIVEKALENIYQQIQQIAENIKKQKINKNKIMKMNQPQPQKQETLLIEDSQIQNQIQNQKQKQNLKWSQQQRRQQEMKNMIKGYITGIQQAKNQSKYSSNSNHYEQQPSFNAQNNFNTTLNGHPMNTNLSPKQVQVDSVSYSFSNNNNLLCQHSFSKDLSANNFHPNHNDSHSIHNFNRYNVKPTIYQPQNQYEQDQQQINQNEHGYNHQEIKQQNRISIPHIEQVKSDCGQIMQHQNQVQSSEEIQFRINKLIPQTLDITGNNIKNIQSVHYEPPAYENIQYNTNKNTTMFRRFDQPIQKVNIYGQQKSGRVMQNNSQIMQEHKITNNNQPTKFISKTFNSYLSNNKERTNQSQQQLPNVINATYNSKTEHQYSQQQIRIKQSTYSSQSNKLNTSNQNIMKIDPITKFQPMTNIIQNSNSQAKYQNQQSFNNNNNNNSFNNSINMNNNDSRLDLIASPKNIHQLSSKNKFSISSPLNQQNNSNKAFKNSNNIQVTNVTQFNNENNLIKKNSQGSDKMMNMSKNSISNQNNSFKYAIAQSIVPSDVHQSISKNSDYYYENPKVYEKPISHVPLTINRSNSNQLSSDILRTSVTQQKITRNSILQMQPMKLSSEKNNMQSFTKPLQSQNSIHIDLSLNDNKTNQISSNSINQINFTKKESISQGRQFLQSLNTKQSIQLQQSVLKQYGLKDSFVEETFRPHTNNTVAYNSQAPKVQIKQNSIQSKNNLQNSNKQQSINKSSITKITIKSLDKNTVSSPKVISLTINQQNSKINEFNTPLTVQTKQKQNIFKNLQIKQSSNSIQKTILNESNTTLNNSKHQILKVHHVNLNNHHQNLNQNSYLNSNQQQNKSKNVDYNLKQNTNTLNQSISMNKNVGLKNQLGKNQSIRFDLNIDQSSANLGQKNLKQSISTTNKPSILQKKEPLLKSSKNFGVTNSISMNQHTYNQIHTSSYTNQTITMNKLSIGESIKGKFTTGNMIGSSRMMKQSTGYNKMMGVKQSIGNDSDMDFDLDLD